MKKRRSLVTVFKRECNRTVLIDLLLISLGSVLWVLAINGLIRPNGFLSSGLTGLVILFDYFYPLPVGAIVFILNIPILIWAWKVLNRRFVAYTLYSSVLISLLIDLTANMPGYNGDPFLAAVFAGLIGGVGGGVIIRRRGSGGGLDVVGIIIKKKMGYSVGTVGNAFNITLIAVSALIFDLEVAMYTIIFILCTNFAVDKAIAGLSKKYTVMIISQKPDEVKEAIFTHTYRGVTFLHGHGAYSGQEKTVLYCVLNQYDLASLTEALAKVDPGALMTAMESSDIFEKIKKGKPKKKLPAVQPVPNDKAATDKRDEHKIP